MRTLRRGSMIFGLELIAGALNLAQDAAFLFFLFSEETAQAERHA